MRLVSSLSLLSSSRYQHKRSAFLSPSLTSLLSFSRSLSLSLSLRARGRSPGRRRRRLALNKTAISGKMAREGGAGAAGALSGAAPGYAVSAPSPPTGSAPGSRGGTGSGAPRYQMSGLWSVPDGRRRDTESEPGAVGQEKGRESEPGAVGQGEGQSQNQAQWVRRRAQSQNLAQWSDVARK